MPCLSFHLLQIFNIIYLKAIPVHCDAVQKTKHPFLLPQVPSYLKKKRFCEELERLLLSISP